MAFGWGKLEWLLIRLGLFLWLKKSRDCLTDWNHKKTITKLTFTSWSYLGSLRTKSSHKFFGHSSTFRTVSKAEITSEQLDSSILPFSFISFHFFSSKSLLQTLESQGPKMNRITTCLLSLVIEWNNKIGNWGNRWIGHSPHSLLHRMCQTLPLSLIKSKYRLTKQTTSSMGYLATKSNFPPS